MYPYLHTPSYTLTSTLTSTYITAHTPTDIHTHANTLVYNTHTVSTRRMSCSCVSIARVVIYVIYILFKYIIKCRHMRRTLLTVVTNTNIYYFIFISVKYVDMYCTILSSQLTLIITTKYRG